MHIFFTRLVTYFLIMSAFVKVKNVPLLSTLHLYEPRDGMRVQFLIFYQSIGIHPKADLPMYVPRSKTLMMQMSKQPRATNSAAPAFGKRKVVLFATCLVNWNKPEIGLAACDVLAHNGVETTVSFPGCCGMPQLEHGKLADVVARAQQVAPQLLRYVDEGYAVVTPIPSCTFMLKQEWPSLLPNDERMKKLAANTYDISEYVVMLSKKEGLMKDVDALVERVTLQHACHARSQNMGFKVCARSFSSLILYMII